METLLLVLAGSLGVLFLWGLISPRSQWRLLVSWSYRDPHANEPTGSAYGVYRLVAALGIATMVLSALGVYHARIESIPTPPAAPTAVERMWGAPDPFVVNRVVTAGTVSPKGLVDQPILGYQVIDGQTRQPPYLFSLPTLKMKQATGANGLVGTKPAAGLVALDTAQLVIEVAGDPKCFPHKVVVFEGANTVRIAVYYGQPNPADGSNEENLANCATDAGKDSVRTLLPIVLENALRDRELQTLSGDPIKKVPLIQQ